MATGFAEVRVSDQLEVWTAVAHLLRAQLTDSVWYSTFAEVVPQINDDLTMLVIQVPSNLARDRILTHYEPRITNAMAEIGVGDRVFDVIIGGSEHAVDPSSPAPAWRRYRARPARPGWAPDRDDR